MTRGWRIASGMLVGFLLLLLAMVLAVLLLLGTEAGSRWLVHRVAPLVPGKLEIGRFDGTLLGDFRLVNTTWQRDGLRVQLDQGHLNVVVSALLEGSLKADTLRLDGLDIRLPPAGDAAAGPEGSAPAGGPPEITLPLAIAIDRGRINDFELRRDEQTLLHFQRIAVQDLHWEDRLAFDELQVRRDGLTATARGSLMLHEPHHVNLGLDWTLPLPDAVAQRFEAKRLRGSASIDGTLDQLSGTHRLLSPRELVTEFQVRPFATPLHLTLDNSWQRLELPLGQNGLALREGNLRLEGTLEQLQANGATTLDMPQLPPLKVSLEATGDLGGAEALSVTAEHGDMRLSATGEASWRPRMSFDLALRGQGLDPAIVLEGWPGNLTLQAKVNGNQTDQGWAVRASSLAVDGSLRGYPVAASGSASLADSRLTLDTRASLAGNSITAKGRVVPGNLAVSGRLVLDQPEAILDSLDGRLSGDYRLAGTPASPRLHLNATGPSVTWQTYQATNVGVTARDLGLDSDSFSLDISVDEVVNGGEPLLEQASLNASGGVSGHDIALTLNHTAFTLQARARGELERQPLVWNGTLTRLEAEPESLVIPAWGLEEDVSLVVGPGRVDMERACLASLIGSVCAMAEMREQKVDASVTLNSVPMTALQPLLGKGINLGGELHGKASLKRGADGRWQGEAQAHVAGGSATIQDEPEPYTLTMETARATASLDGQRLEAEASVVLAEHGNATARLATNLADESAPLDGSLEMSLDNLRWLELILPQIRQPSGHVSGDLALDGTRRQPRVSGTLSLREGSALVPETGIALRNVEFQARGTGSSTLRFSGKAESGPGQVSLDGSLDLARGFADSLQLHLGGERFQVVNQRDMEILANPDLDVSLNDEVVRVRGSVTVPKAKITPEQAPARAVSVSEDQVLVHQQEDEQKPPLAVNAEVELVLGENIVFEGFGLRAEPDGQVTLIKKPGKPLRLRGELLIDQGRYRAYGQNLQITRGRLLFQDAADNPALDIRAVRRIPSAEVTVGVNIGGTLKEPQASIFSEPPMEESEAMAWLLTGRGLSGASDSDNAQIAQALALYGLEKGSGVTENIGEKLGVDEISIGSTWETGDAALMLGKQISDRLYLRYAAGLFNAVSTVMLRYTINRNLHLEAQTGGNQQSLDLIYQIER